MRKPLNRIGGLLGSTVSSGVLLLGLALSYPAAAQLYGAGRNNGAVTIDEDVLTSLGGGAPRPGVGVGYLPAPAAAPRSRINQIPLPKPKPTQPPIAAPVVPAPPPASAVSVGVGAPVPPPAPALPASAPPVALTVAPVAVPVAPPEAPKPDPGPPPAPPPPQAAITPPPPQVAVTPIPPPAPAPAPMVTPVVAAPPPVAAPAVTAPAPVTTAKGVRLLFLPDSSEVPSSARPALDGLVKQLQGQPERRVLITAFAAGTAETASQSRRLSLNRALAVRSFLAEQGVNTARLDVRALGSQVADGPADRVDLDLTTP